MALESRKHTTLDDPGADLLDRLTRFWDRYGRIVLGAMVAVVVVGVAAYYITAGNRTRENSASEKLAQANDLFWRADYDRSRQLAQDAAKEFPGTSSATDALRIAGDDAYWRGNWKDAIADYNAYLAKKGSGVLADAVRRSLAYAMESNAQFTEASAVYDEFHAGQAARRCAAPPAVSAMRRANTPRTSR